MSFLLSPFLSPPLPSSPSLSSPLPSSGPQPHNAATGFRECCKLPQWSRQSLASRQVLVYFQLKRALLVISVKLLNDNQNVN